MIKVKNFKITKSNSFTEINPLGLYIYNSPTEYLKFGSGIADLRVPQLKVNDLAVYGDLYVYGSTISTSTSSGNLFVIGDGETSEQTKLKFGSYTNEVSLYTEGSNLISSKPIEATDFIKNGNSLFSNITREVLILSSILNTNIPVALPNNASYELGSNKLFVLVEGIVITKNVDYTEVDTTHVSFNKNLPNGIKIEFIIIG